MFSRLRSLSGSSSGVWRSYGSSTRRRFEGAYGRTTYSQLTLRASRVFCRLPHQYSFGCSPAYGADNYRLSLGFPIPPLESSTFQPPLTSVIAEHFVAGLSC